MIENLHLWIADRGTYFDRNVNIITWSDKYVVNLGKYNSIGRDCNFFLDANHRADWITTTTQLLGPVTPEISDMLANIGHPTSRGNITIENDVWIGAKATIMSGVKIGNGAIVSANSVVYKNVKPYSIVGGNPATEWLYRFNEEQIKNLLEIKWWEWPEDKIRSEAMLLWSNNINIFIEKHKV